MPHPFDSPADEGRALRVLVVEGHTACRLLLCALVSRVGRAVEVEADDDGERALARALAQPPDLVLIGLSTPPLGGHEIARRLRAELGPAPFLVALSSYAEAEDRRQAREAGFDAYGWKPIRPEEAGAWVEEAAARAGAGRRVGGNHFTTMM